MSHNFDGSGALGALVMELVHNYIRLQSNRAMFVKPEEIQDYLTDLFVRTSKEHKGCLVADVLSEFWGNSRWI
ncbi:hypothetical protein Hdeb2414_s0794g00947841 [Helianthus debilis subsp. tardiflorus]